MTDCVRTYSTDYGLDQIAGIAARHGLKVIQGLWLSSHPDKNRDQIETAVALAKRYPDTIRAVVVGNEVLLRGEMSGDDLAATIREVKVAGAGAGDLCRRLGVLAAQSARWRRRPISSPSISCPIGRTSRSRRATPRRMSRRSASGWWQAFPGKEVLIGEVGWPSAGRMREGALPSPANQARVIQDVLALAARENFRVNVIEAYDQPWKRALEGTVGGHWGLISDGYAAIQIRMGRGGVQSSAVALAGGRRYRVCGRSCSARRSPPARAQGPAVAWLAVTGNAMAGGALIGWTIANVPLESSGRRRMAALACAWRCRALSAPMVSAAIMRGVPIPRLSRLLGPASERARDPLALAVGALLIATMLLAVLTALGLVFDPRYKDFPFAPLTAAAVPFLLHTLAMPRPPGARGAAEILTALLLALSVPYIVLNESLANWQSLWLCAALLALAVTLVQVRDARS